MKRAVLLPSIVVLACCATRPSAEPLAELALYGAGGTWSGELTRADMTLRLPGGETLAVRNPGFPCPENGDTCFFGDVGGSRYVNLRRRDGRRVSLVADREPCGNAGGGRRHPYVARVHFHGEGPGGRDRVLEGCAGPLRQRGR